MRNLYKSRRYAQIVSGFEIGGEACYFEVKTDNEFAFYNFVKRDISAEVSGLECGKFFDITTPFDYGGIYCSSPEVLPLFFEKFSKWCKENNIISEFIRFDPCSYFDMDLISNHIDILRVNNLIYMDLTVDFWSEYSRGRKSNIARVKNLNYQIEVSTIENFMPLYKESMKRNCASEYFYFDSTVLSSLISNGFGRVFCIGVDGNTVASIMILDDDERSYYFLGASSSETLSLDINALLFHEVALLLKEEGKTMFFLGGGREGVYNFKQRFSKKTLPYYIGRKVHNQALYDDLVGLTKRWDNNFFPKYREKVI